ncbi:MAG: glutaminyl-peptide cyclotransferase [Chloroflexota bacterium]
MNYFLIFMVLIFSAFSCKSKESKVNDTNVKSERTNAATPYGMRRYQLKIIRSFPHDTSSYTQGLLYNNGKLYESAGLVGKSSIRIVDFTTGAVIKKENLPYEYFAEGLAEMNGSLYQLTWQNEKGFVRNVNSLKVISEFNYSGEGWGLTTQHGKFLLTDGTNNIKIFNPDGFKLEKIIPVFRDDAPLMYLNELEMAGDKLYANIYGEDKIYIINPETGFAEGVIDCYDLRKTMPPLPFIEVMNGIAYIPENDSFVLTGKFWTHYFECKFIPE